MAAIWAPWLTRVATHCRVWPAQRAAGAAAGDRDREGLGALVVGAGAAEGPAVGGVEGLVQGSGGPALGDRGQVDRADGQGVGGAGAAQGAAGDRVEDQVEGAGRRGRWARCLRPCCRCGRWPVRSGWRRWHSPESSHLLGPAFAGAGHLMNRPGDLPGLGERRVRAVPLVCGWPGWLVPLLAAARVCTTQDRPQENPQDSPQRTRRGGRLWQVLPGARSRGMRAGLGWQGCGRWRR